MLPDKTAPELPSLIHRTAARSFAAHAHGHRPRNACAKPVRAGRSLAEAAAFSSLFQIASRPHRGGPGGARSARHRPLHPAGRQILPPDRAGPRPFALQPLPSHRPPPTGRSGRGQRRGPSPRRAPWLRSGRSVRASAGNGDGAAAFRCFPFRRTAPLPNSALPIGLKTWRRSPGALSVRFPCGDAVRGFRCSNNCRGLPALPRREGPGKPPCPHIEPAAPRCAGTATARRHGAPRRRERSDFVSAARKRTVNLHGRDGPTAGLRDLRDGDQNDSVIRLAEQAVWNKRANIHTAIAFIFSI